MSFSSKLLDSILIIDTETGGLDPNQHSILSLGFVTWDQQQQQEFFVLEEQLLTTPRSMEINQIDLQWLKKNGKSPIEVCEQIDQFLSTVNATRPLMLVGHNISFDLAFLKRLYHLSHRSFPDDFSHRSLDTHSLLWILAQQGRIPWQACSSDGAFQYFNVSPPANLRHTALGDAIATRHLLVKIMEYFA
jgi:DNA polymerase III subunit epsilon